MSVNKVILLGNLGKDPELKMTTSQTAICNFSLATSDRVKKDGEWVDKTEWHNVIAFGKTAENAAKYLVKGKQVFIEGKIQTRKWQDKEGKDRYTTEILANTIQFVGAKSEGAKSEPEERGHSIAASLPAQGEIPFDDDDIPFQHLTFKDEDMDDKIKIKLNSKEGFRRIKILSMQLLEKSTDDLNKKKSQMQFGSREYKKIAREVREINEIWQKLRLSLELEDIEITTRSEFGL